MNNLFSDLGISHPQLLSALDSNNFVTPTPIQEKAIPVVIEGKDVYAQAETGSGKTAAFSLPLIQTILSRNLPAAAPIFVILSPTRELAQQTMNVINLFGGNTHVKAACLIGGESYEQQKSLLNSGIHFLIGTPGRIIDLYKQKLVDFTMVESVVFDEADRLFDMGFKEDIVYLLKQCPKNRQLLLFSATNNFDVLNTVYKFGSMPIEINVNVDTIMVDHIEQKLYHVGDGEKVPLLVSLIKQHLGDGTCIVFANTQNETHLLSDWLMRLDLNLKIKSISGKLPQQQRTKLMSDFKSGQINVLISTDVAARGLDVDSISLVINYDLPSDASNYVHRIGRTGRAGKSGKAYSFCAFDDCKFLSPIEKYIGSKIPTEHVTEDLLAIDVGPRPILTRKYENEGTMMEDTNKRHSPRNGNSDNRGNRNPPRGNDRGNDRQDNRAPRGRNDNRPRNEARGDNRNDQRNGAPRRNDRNRDRDAGPRRERTDGRNFPKAGPILDKFETIVTASDLKSASAQAMEKMKLQEKQATDLRHEVLEKGKRAFFGLFGPRDIKYRFYLNYPHEMPTREFFKNLLKLAKIDLDFKITCANDFVLIDLVGND